MYLRRRSVAQYPYKVSCGGHEKGDECHIGEVDTMTLIVVLLIASIVSSVLVVAAGILSSRSTAPEEFVETYSVAESGELPAEGLASPE